MTPKEAINLLDQVASQIQMVRADHSKAIEAVTVLTELINSMTQSKKSERGE